MIFLSCWSRSAWTQDPDEPQAPRTLEDGYRFLASGQLESALGLFRELLAVSPESLSAHEGLVWTLLALGDSERAAQEADNLLAFDPEDNDRKEAWLRLIVQIPERRSEAIATYRELLQEDPTNVDLHLALADVLSWTEGRRAEAADEYRLVLDLDPENHAARLGLAQTLSWSGRHEEAIDLYRQLVLEDPANLEFRIRLAEVLSWAEGRADDAIQEFRTVLKLDPDNRLALLGLARTLSWNGRSGEANDLFEALLSADPNDVDALYGKAQIAVWSNEPVLAEQLLRSASAIRPDDERVTTLLDEVMTSAVAIQNVSRGASLLLTAGVIAICLLLGTVTPRINYLTYLALALLVALLVSITLIGFYLDA